MKQLKIVMSMVIAIAAIGIAVLALRGRSTAAVPADGTSVERKVVKKRHLKKSSAPARAKTVEALSAKAAKPAADGRLWDSNLLLMDQCGAVKEKIVRDAAVELYNQLDVDNVPDAENQKIIKWTTYNTSFSFDCYEPVLQVYDKVYKNMGFGKGIFSWCVRPLQKK